jgi:hypothetical protein
MMIRSMKPEARREHVNKLLDDYFAACEATGLDEESPALLISWGAYEAKQFFAYPQIRYVVAPWFGTAADLLVVMPKNGDKKYPVALSLASIDEIAIVHFEPAWGADL